MKMLSLLGALLPITYNAITSQDVSISKIENGSNYSISYQLSSSYFTHKSTYLVYAFNNRGYVLDLGTSIDFGDIFSYVNESTLASFGYGLIIDYNPSNNFNSFDIEIFKSTYDVFNDNLWWLTFNFSSEPVYFGRYDYSRELDTNLSVSDSYNFKSYFGNTSYNSNGFWQVSSNYLMFNLSKSSQYFTIILNHSYVLNDLDTFNAYQEGYLDGRHEGYDEGYSEGKSDGLSEGEDIGFSHGKEVGIQEGVNQAHTYTFANLFGAIADTPVLIVRSLFNFDFFGVNMLYVVLSLFTALILFFILRKLL